MTGYGATSGKWAETDETTRYSRKISWSKIGETGKESNGEIRQNALKRGDGDGNMMISIWAAIALC